MRIRIVFLVTLVAFCSPFIQALASHNHDCRRDEGTISSAISLVFGRDESCTKLDFSTEQIRSLEREYFEKRLTDPLFREFARFSGQINTHFKVFTPTVSGESAWQEADSPSIETLGGHETLGGQ